MTPGPEFPQGFQCFRCAPLRPKPIRLRKKVRLEDRLQYQLDRHLDHPVPHRRDTQRPLPSICLGDVPAQHHLRPILSGAQHSSKLFQEALDSIPLHLGDRLRIHPSRSLVGTNPSPRLPQNVTSVDVVVQGVKTSLRRPLGRGPQSPLQVAHFLARPTAAGVVRSGRAGHSLARACSSHTTTPGTLPSRGVVRRRDPWYYDPLGLPLRTTRFRLRLIRVRLPRQRPRRRASRVPSLSLSTCCAPYPAGTPDRLRSSSRGHGLRRDMSGSAPGL